MELLKTLLDNYIIIKEDNRDLYYDIKDNLKSFKTFIQEKLGYDILTHQDFIKLEKFPGRVHGWMGIDSFEEKLDYCLFILLIMFLEDKGKEEQFVLSQLIEYVTLNFEEDNLDWTVYSNRKAIIRVLKFALKLKIMKVNDGDEDNFANNVSAEVLYENTGLSKYIVRSFPMDITEAKSYKDFINFAWKDIDDNRGALRRNRVYRDIVMSPVLYNEGSEDQDFYYLKNFKGIIENDIEKYLSWKLHVHKDAALIVLEEQERINTYFPYNSAISDIALCLNKLIVDKLKDKEMNINENSNIELSRDEFKKLLSELRNSKSHGWSKEYRECNDMYLYEGIINYMKGYNMLFEKEDKIIIRPIVGKIIGDYPKNFNEKENNRE